MARRKASDKKITGKEVDIPKVQADDHSIAFEEIHIGGNVGGDIRIGHTIGYTAEQVSVLLKQITTTLQPKKFDGRCPYKGLEVFEEEDAELFFGRERLVSELVGRVKESRTVFITGPSGSGKSSLVRAGLIHDLKQGAIKGSGSWLYETLKPGREPLKDLALAFSRLKSPELQDYFLAHISETTILDKCAESVLSGRKDQRFVLFVDQFEEVFTQINSEEERVAFINMLAHAGTLENGRVIVLFSMRSDFVSNCATYPALNELLSQEFRQIGAMQPEELVSAIALPARHVGLPIEDELIARIINDMKGEPDALPLMQFALKDLFDTKQAEGGVVALTLADYLKHGGIHKSLERHADATFAKLSEHEQELTRSIFSGLIEIGRGTQDTKRTALFDELIPASAKSEDVLAIVQKLADARLIITDEQAGKDTVTISHEKLIEAWPWLKKLVNENRDVIAMQNEIAGDAEEWEENKHDPSYLYSGTRLANISEQLDAKKLVLSETSNEFVNAGQAQEKRNRRIRIMGIAIPIGLVIVAVILFSYISSANSAKLAEERLLAANTQVALASTSEAVAVTAQAAAEEAQKQATIASAGQIAAQSLEINEKNFQLSLLLGVEAFRKWDNTQSRAALLYATETHPQLLQYFAGQTGKINSVALSPDGRILASGSENGTIFLWDTKTGQPIGQPLPGNQGDVLTVSFSPDGTIIAAGNTFNTILLWDVKTRQLIGQPFEYIDTIESIAFSPDGKILASASGNGIILLWDVKTHQPIGRPLLGHTNIVKSVTFSPDGKTLASGSYDSTIILWDVNTQVPLGKPLLGSMGGSLITSIAFSPDGKILASGSSDGTIILSDIVTRQPIGQPLMGHTDVIESVAFSPDDKTIASGSRDKTIILWDVETLRPIGQPLTGHRDSVESVAFSLDGKTLASGGADSTNILWEVESRQPISQSLTRHTDSVESVVFSQDSKTLASGSRDKTIILWNVETHQPIGQPLRGHTDVIESVAFSPDGKILATSSNDGTIILWDRDNLQHIGKQLIGDGFAIASIAFSPDGRIMASGNYNDASRLYATITLWDMETRKPIGSPLTEHTSSVQSLAFSPDGRILASGSGDGTIIFWDLDTRHPLGPPLTGHNDIVNSVAFSPNGKILASGSYNGTIFWDVATRVPIGPSFTSNAGIVESVAFSPDGKILASGNSDSTVILWDVATRQPIGPPLIGHAGYVSSMAFSPDGKILASGGWDGLVNLWDIDPLSWMGQVCQRAGRNFTRIEWIQYFPNEEYRKTCDQWPLEPAVIPTTTP